MKLSISRKRPNNGDTRREVKRLVEEKLEKFQGGSEKDDYQTKGWDYPFGSRFKFNIENFSSSEKKLRTRPEEFCTDINTSKVLINQTATSLLVTITV